MSQASPTLKAGPPPLASHPGDALPIGTRLAEFEIRSVLGAGGFGIVYLAWDHALEREVALKEYMPVTLAGRGPGHRVTIRAASHEETFAMGLRSFVNEARLLARFDHPSLVKVFRFWEDNGTAYMAMPMYHGRTLRQVRQAMAPGSPGEAWARALIDPMLGALERLHREDVYHRDIAPDNIVLSDEGQAVLLDFGAARRVIGDRSHALTAILKPHFAPIEQYADVAAMRQGPWTDLYGLAATVYYLLTGQPPLPAAARALHDELPPLARLQPAGCSPSFLQAVDWAMAVRPQERPQSVALWRDVLEGRMAVPSLLRHDTTLPGVTALAAASPPGAKETDFDPTVPLPLSELPAARAPGTAQTESPLWRGFTVPRGEPSASAGPASAAADPSSITRAGSGKGAGAQGGAPPPARAAGAAKARWLWGGLAGTALALVVAFVVVLPSPKPAVSAAEGPQAQPQGEWVRSKAPASGMAAAVPANDAVRPASRQPEQGATLPASAGTVAAGTRGPASAGPRPQPGPVAAARERGRERERDPDGDTANRSAVTGPAERCANRMFLTRLICMRKECDTDARLRSHPECVRMQKAEQERRERIMER